MKLFSNEHRFNHSWPVVSAANWIKYPNEMTTHVIHVDYLSRYVDPATGILHTARLLTCRQGAPQFIAQLFGASNEAYIYEASEVDPVSQTLTLRAKNLTLAQLMTVEETCTYTPSLSDANQTIFKQEARITSLNGFSLLRNRIEEFCLDRFRSNAIKGRAALESVLDRIRLETREAASVVNALYEETVEAVSALCDETIEAVTKEFPAAKEFLPANLATVHHHHGNGSSNGNSSSSTAATAFASTLERDPKPASSAAASPP